MEGFWNAAQVAEYLSVSVDKVRKDEAAGLMPRAGRMGRLVRWNSKSVIEWAESGFKVPEGGFQPETAE